jgi:cytochrome c oxidase subunit I
LKAIAGPTPGRTARPRRHPTVMISHWAGVEGMPRRVAHYPLLPGSVTTLSQVSSVGSFLLGASTLFFLWNVYMTSRHGQRETADDPWGYANSLEWVTSCSPPRHNFTSIPRIRSERPAFDLHYRHIMSGRRRMAVPGPAAQQGQQPPRP